MPEPVSPALKAVSDAVLAGPSRLSGGAVLPQLVDPARGPAAGAHAAPAIGQAGLYERSRELSILSERNRLALELHDVVSQKLFSLNLAAEAATTLLDRGADEARPQLERVRDLAREALAELRSLIF